MEAEMRSLGIDPEAAMQRVAKVVGGRKGRLSVSKHAELKDYFKTPRLQELYEFYEGRVYSAREQERKKQISAKDIFNDRPGRKLVAESNNKQHHNITENKDFNHQYNVSVNHQACYYVQDTTTLQRDLKCAFDAPQKRLKEVMILRCINHISFIRIYGRWLD
jgi:hypothetical protein